MDFRRCLACYALLVAASPAHSQIAYVQGRTLYSVPADRHGLPTGKPVRICQLWKDAPGDSVEIGWTPRREILLVHHVDAWNGPRRFGLSQEGPVSGIWVVSPTAGARPRKLATGQFPAFTSDGGRMLFATGDFESDVWELDRTAGTRRLVQANATQPVVSAKGDRVAWVSVSASPELETRVEVRTYPELKRIAKDRPSVSPTDLRFSPDGRVLAIHNHLSRPLTGHRFWGLGQSSLKAIPTPIPFAPPVVTDWSEDGKRLLAELRVVDPQNDGSWIREYVGVLPTQGAAIQQKWLGNTAAWSPDQHHVLYLSDGRSGVPWRPQSLYWRPFDGGSPRQLIRNVRGFSLFRRGRFNLSFLTSLPSEPRR